MSRNTLQIHRSLQVLQTQIESCSRCPRLHNHCASIAKTKRRAFIHEEYWGKPVSGFGDPHAQFLIVGLAPGAHGANRTGRIFTGDRSGEWLYRALYEAGFSNSPISTYRNDGLKLKNVFISCVVRCAPPQNKPLPQEMKNCLPHLTQEMALLQQIRLILALGQVAHQTLWPLHEPQKPIPPFQHGAQFQLSQEKTLLLSYHPSQQNTFTGKLTDSMWKEIFQRAQKILEAIS